MSISLASPKVRVFAASATVGLAASGLIACCYGSLNRARQHPSKRRPKSGDELHSTTLTENCFPLASVSAVRDPDLNVFSLEAELQQCDLVVALLARLGATKQRTRRDARDAFLDRLERSMQEWRKNVANPEWVKSRNGYWQFASDQLTALLLADEDCDRDLERAFGQGRILAELRSVDESLSKALEGPAERSQPTTGCSSSTASCCQNFSASSCSTGCCCKKAKDVDVLELASKCSSPEDWDRLRDWLVDEEGKRMLGDNSYLAYVPEAFKAETEKSVNTALAYAKIVLKERHAENANTSKIAGGGCDTSNCNSCPSKNCAGSAAEPAASFSEVGGALRLSIS